MAPVGQQPEPASLALQTVFCLWSDMVVSLLNRKKMVRGFREKRRRTAGQQNPPQQDSPATQKVSPQHVDPFGMQKGAKLEEAGMQHCTVHSFSASPATASAPCVPRAILTIRVETLAAHVPRTEVIRTAGEDPRFAGGDIVVQRRCQGCEYGSVGSRRLGEEGQGGDIGREGCEWDVACGCVDAVSCTDQEADYSWQKHGDDRSLQNSHSLVAGSRFDSGLIGRNQDDTRCSRQ